MKKWEELAITGGFSLAIGVVLLLWAFQAIEPITIHTNWLGQLERAEIDEFFLYPLILGAMLSGVGVGALSAVGMIYKLEKELVDSLSKRSV